MAELLSPYQQWQKEEGIPVIKGFHIQDLRSVPVHPWPRKGGKGVFINMEGTGDSNDSYICEIAPGGSLTPEKYLYEEVIYVVSGRGATTVWQDGASKQTVEWQAGSLFAIPLNAWHQHHNGSGKEPTRYYGVTTAPLVMNLFHNREFIFNNPHVFGDRFAGQDEYFSGKGKFLETRVWESNFIPDVKSFELQPWKERGAGGVNVNFELAENTMIAHISQFPVGTYKKAHRHGPGAHVIILSGKGYSLLWPDKAERTRVNWHEGSVFVPPNMWWHQHFNAGAEPARYLAIRWGSTKYKIDEKWDRLARDRREGGDQIEYDDEDPEIRKIFEQELSKVGAKSRMAEVVGR